MLERVFEVNARCRGGDNIVGRPKMNSTDRINVAEENTLKDQGLVE